MKKLSARIIFALSLFATAAAFARTHVDALREKIVVGLQARLPKSRIWVNTMWDSLCNGHADYKGLRGKPEDCWGWCVDVAKATFIQTDAGKELIAYLQQRGKREL